MEDLNKNKEQADSETQNIFTKVPEQILNHEPIREKSGLKFCFSSGNRKYHLGINEGQPYFKIEYFGDLPSGLTEDQKRHFIKENYKVGEMEQSVYVISSEHAPSNINTELEANTLKEKNYSVTQPRVFERGDNSPKPKEISLTDLAEMISKARTIFYTGAGISMSGNVHGLAGLEKELGIGRQGEVDDFLKNCISNPELILESWSDFVESLDGPPTEAHKALGVLAIELKSQIITENVDTLHENAGVRPLRIMGSYLRDKVNPEWLNDIDIIVTIGLSHDDRSFLGWYKQNNPGGIIIAIDIAQPSFLGDEDYIVKGDLQRLVPELLEKLHK